MKSIKVDTPIGRHYQIEDKLVPSVNAIINASRPKEFLLAWAGRLGEKLVNAHDYAGFSEEAKKALATEAGKREAERIRAVSAQRGIMAHKLIEDCFKRAIDKRALIELSPLFYKLVESICPVCAEKLVYYNRDNLRFAGTIDLVGAIDGRKIVGEKGEPIVEGEILCLFDWKFPIHIKNPREGNREGYYYPLIAYCLQVSAYIGAFNACEGMGIEWAAIAMVSQDRRFKMFVLNAEEIDWYWQHFLLMVARFGNGGCCDWKELGILADRKGYLGTEVFLRKD